MAGNVRIGVLALQGAVTEHQQCLDRLGVESVSVKTPEQLSAIDGLILPGGESTTIGRLLRSRGMLEPLRERVEQGFPLMGTCAGLIVMAQQIVGQEETYLGTLRVQVERNAFGRQRESFEQSLPVEGMDSPFPAVFIRAPQIVAAEPDVRVLATLDQTIVAVQQENQLALSFHPELTSDVRFHRLFVQQVQEAAANDTAFLRKR